MTDIIPITLVVEDSLSEAVVRVILEQSGRHYFVSHCYGQVGSGYIRNKIRGFNNAAKGTPFLVLTDLDKSECPPGLIEEWLPEPKHPNLLFRIAVREVESWLLGHRSALSKFLGIQRGAIPHNNVDAIDNPKQLIINLARKSRYRSVREAIVPPFGSTAKVGPDYNGKLISFVKKHWKAPEAMCSSSSLKQSVQIIANFTPI